MLVHHFHIREFTLCSVNLYHTYQQLYHICFYGKHEIKKRNCHQINHSEILYATNVRLLGVIFDEHLKFHSYVDHIVDKTKHALHGLIKLRKAGVRSHALVLFYNARILSVLSYAAPCWFPHTSQNDKVKLGGFQKLCTRIMISYEEE